MKCEKVFLSEVCDLVPGYAFRGKDFGVFKDKVIKITHITPPTVDMDSLVGIDIDKYDISKLEKFIAQKGDYVLAMTGATIGKIGRVERGCAYVNQRVLLFKNKKCVDKNYLYYVLKQKEFEQYVFNHIDSNSAQPNISASTIGNFSFDLPDLVFQKKIGDGLRLLDEKIAINRAINDNLQQQAQALYENIFCIHSDIDTKHISLSDLMDYAGGSQPPASEFVFSERDGYIRFVQIRDYDTDSHITYIPDSPKNKLCEEHDIMIARYGASLGRICYGINGAYNVALAKVFPKKSFFREFLRCYLSSRTFYEGINNKGGRSAQAGFNQSDINSFEIDFPVDETIVKKFECTVAPMFEQRLQLKKENQHLASLRDTILPKLMSGELDVSKIKI